MHDLHGNCFAPLFFMILLVWFFQYLFVWWRIKSEFCQSISVAPTVLTLSCFKSTMNSNYNEQFVTYYVQTLSVDFVYELRRSVTICVYIPNTTRSVITQSFLTCLMMWSHKHGDLSVSITWCECSIIFRVIFQCCHYLLSLCAWRATTESSHEASRAWKCSLC